MSKTSTPQAARPECLAIIAVIAEAAVLGCSMPATMIELCVDG
ncbi:hypothetical protein [Salinibacterium xinjiangense]|nr:hypothetical protein [Salinibacterium xinjiangense]